MSDDALTKATYEKVVRHLRSKIPEPDCYDIAQECVVTFCAKDQSTIANPRAFLWGIVRNKVRQFYDARNRLLSAMGVYDMLPVETMMTRLSTRVARRDDLEGALQSLPLRQQQVFELRFLEELPLEDCAEVMDCSLATIKRDLEAGRAALASALGCPLDRDEDAAIVVRRFLERR
jgi:RNA polymerase sigma factor (sigma-70 family)